MDGISLLTGTELLYLANYFDIKRRKIQIHGLGLKFASKIARFGNDAGRRRPLLLSRNSKTAFWEAISPVTTRRLCNRASKKKSAAFRFARFSSVTPTKRSFCVGHVQCNSSKSRNSRYGRGDICGMWGNIPPLPLSLSLSLSFQRSLALPLPSTRRRERCRRKHGWRADRWRDRLRPTDRMRELHTCSANQS